MGKKQWVVHCSEVDTYYFDNLEDAQKEYEELKDHLMSEGHDPSAQVHLLETIKMSTSVVDTEKMKESTPKDEGHDFDNWAEWEEVDFTEQSEKTAKG